MGTKDVGGCLLPLPTQRGDRTVPWTLGLQGESLSADWTPSTYSDDAGPYCGWNCGTPWFHSCLVLTVSL